MAMAMTFREVRYRRNPACPLCGDHPRIRALVDYEAFVGSGRPMMDVRHHRQRILPEVGAVGQRRLEDTSVLIVGLGALGSPVALYLAAAGVGRIGLLDDQRVELPNLNRQILYQDSDQGRPKVEAARDRLRALDPSVQLDAIVENFRPSNAGRLVPPYVPARRWDRRLRDQVPAE